MPCLAQSPPPRPADVFLTNFQGISVACLLTFSMVYQDDPKTINLRGFYEEHLNAGSDFLSGCSACSHGG
jgi:hypothetical protein